VIQEFKEFINRGSVVDLAVAFVMGLAFKPIIDAIVGRVLMPIIGMLVGQPNFDALGTFACEAAGSGAIDPAAGILVGDRLCAGSIGAVITALVNFLLIALALFFVVKAYNRMQRATPEEPEPEAEPEDVTLLREIRDALTRR
jgi:large conductance mechanosensitive channel